MAASLVPVMAKGSDAARSAHIAFNVLALGLFTWQLPTGWEIMLKVRLIEERPNALCYSGDIVPCCSCVSGDQVYQISLKWFCLHERSADCFLVR